MPIGKLLELEQHHHRPQLVAPSGAAPVTLTSHANAWTLGDPSADIIAANAVTLPFDIHWAVISDPSADASYEIVLYYGAADTECARIAFTRSAIFVQSITVPVQTIILPLKSRVRAKMMDSVGGSGALLKIFYHTYTNVSS